LNQKTACLSKQKNGSISPTQKSYSSIKKNIKNEKKTKTTTIYMKVFERVQPGDCCNRRHLSHPSVKNDMAANTEQRTAVPR
jgi:hypothetical protein